MALDLSNNKRLYEGIKEHLGHNIEVGNYADGTNVAIECLTCYSVLVDADLEDCEDE